MISRLAALLRSLWQGIRRRSAIEDEMSAEFRLHIELRAADLVRSGLPALEALLRARREFGSAERYKEEGRQSRGLRRIDELRFSWLDFKLGFRMLARYPGLTIVGGLDMAVAIAIGAGAFEAIKQVVRPTLPFPDGDRIVAIRQRDVAANRDRSATVRDFLAWREQLESARELGGWRTIARNLIDEQGESGPVELAEMSATAFKLTRVAPLLGRVLVEADEEAGAPLVIVIGYDVWQTRFHGDATVIGRHVQLGRAPATVVGVMPKSFAFPFTHNMWAPLQRAALAGARDANAELEVFGQLAPGVKLEEAQAELTALGQRAAADDPETHQYLRPHIKGYAQAHTPITCTSSWSRCLSFVRALIFSSNVIFVVLVALVCANVALLMFARAATRESEIIVRSALGASRGRIITQLMAEALVLGGVAACAGLATAGFALRTVLRLLHIEGSIPFWWHAGLSPASVAYAVVLALLGATIAGVLPALKVTRGAGVPLRQAGTGTSGLQFGGVWTVVIVSQVAITVLAVATTAYISQFATRFAAFDLNFPAREYLSAQLVMDDEIPAGLYNELERRLLAEPGVTGVTFATQVPGGDHRFAAFEVDGLSGPAYVQTADVDDAFFRTMNVPINAGRGFLAGDFAADQHVAVVNEEFVKRVLGNRNAIGQRVRFRVSDWRDRVEWGPWYEVVGVLQQLAMTRHPEMSPAGIYLPLQQRGNSVHMAIHMRGDPESFAARLRSIASTLEPGLRLHEMLRMDRIGSRNAQIYSIGVRFLIAASLLVLALSLAGVYAIMSFTVSRRTREIGIRVALGADRRRIMLSIFRRPLAQWATGIVVGVSLSLLYLRGEVEQSVAGGLSSTMQVFIVLAFTAAMLGICLLACIVPTRRALAVQPTEALRQE